VRSTIRVLCTAVLSAAAIVPAARAHAQQATEYERRELTIPVRDGSRLFAVALIPKDVSQPLPIILIRTPFNAAREFRSAELPSASRCWGCRRRRRRRQSRHHSPFCTAVSCIMEYPEPC
jgi:predicted acyl esterase